MPALAEIQHDRSKVVSQSSGSVHFNHEIMLQGPQLSRERLGEYVEKFAGEHFFQATYTPVYFDGNEWYHPDSEPYSDFFERGVAYYSDNNKLKKRFMAEGEGYENAKTIVNQYLAEEKQPPAMVINSPPADVYNNGAFVPRDVYFLLVPVCERSMSLGGGSEKTYWEFELLTIPHESTSTRDQWEQTLLSVDLHKSLDVLRISLDQVNENDPNWVVAMPLILENVTTFCSHLGYVSFDHLEDQARNSLRLTEDSTAIERRKDMIIYFTDEMWKYVQRRGELTYEDGKRLKSLTDVMHYYLSAEGGGEYIGWSFSDIQKLIEGHTYIEYRNAGITFTPQEYAYVDWEYADMAYNNYFYRLQQNGVTQERLANAGCPINMSQSLLNSRFGGIESLAGGLNYQAPSYPGFDLKAKYGYQEGTTTTTSSEDKGEKECYQCPMTGCGADVYTKNGDTYCLKGHHKGR